MLKLVVVSCLVGVALGVPAPVVRSYHEAVGIQAAAAIKAAEENSDFDGSRIVGGSAAALGQFPYMGGLVVTLADGRLSACGSSLLSNTRLVTAAHCWWDGHSQTASFEVVLGSVLLFSGGTRVRTSNVIMHAGWNPLTIENDVAVIVIPWVNYNNNIRNIQLPPASLLAADFAGWWGAAAGFGVQRDGVGISSTQTLHFAPLQVISNEECRRVYNNFIVESTLCIDGSTGRSICNSDSGGPLAVDVGGPVLIGVTSFGHFSGCETRQPAAFARVTSFVPWLTARL